MCNLNLGTRSLQDGSIKYAVNLRAPLSDNPEAAASDC